MVHRAAPGGHTAHQWLTVELQQTQAAMISPDSVQCHQDLRDMAASTAALDAAELTCQPPLLSIKHLQLPGDPPS